MIISRAGASSVSEIAVAGVPSILVPLPIAADDHQTSNAQEIADAKAGLLIKQNEFTAENLKPFLKIYSVIMINSSRCRTAQKGRYQRCRQTAGRCD